MTRLLPGDRLRLAELGPDLPRQCEWDGKPLSGRQQRFCSDACRAAAHRSKVTAEASSYAQYRARVAAGATSVERYSDAWWKYVLSNQGVDPSEILSHEEHRALSKGALSAGGYLVPQDFAEKVAAAAVAESAVAQLATQIGTDDGETPGTHHQRLRDRPVAR